MIKWKPESVKELMVFQLPCGKAEGALKLGIKKFEESMSESLRITVEIGFNIFYLSIIWLFVVLMVLKVKKIHPLFARQAKLVLWAFLLLAIGDTGHVGFRVLAYNSGGLDQSLTLFGMKLPLVGAGALATAITVTFFYMILLELWRVRFQKQQSTLFLVLLLFGIVRLILFIFPGNQWDNVVPPFDWSLIRNIPLMVQGLGAAILMLFSSVKERDRTYLSISLMIFTSFFFYIPVILLVQRFPMVGMLMIPKTLAYLAIAFICYFGIFRKHYNEA